MGIYSATEDLPSATLTIATVRFGTPEQVQVTTSSLYTFPEALPGLPDSHRYALVSEAAYAPLSWLQSLDENFVCLPLLPLGSLAMPAYIAEVRQSLVEAQGSRGVLYTPGGQ